MDDWTNSPPTSFLSPGMAIASTLADTTQQRAMELKERGLGLKHRSKHYTVQHQGTCVWAPRQHTHKPDHHDTDHGPPLGSDRIGFGIFLLDLNGTETDRHQCRWWWWSIGGDACSRLWMSLLTNELTNALVLIDLTIPPRSPLVTPFIFSCSFSSMLYVCCWPQPSKLVAGVSPPTDAMCHWSASFLWWHLSMVSRALIHDYQVAPPHTLTWNQKRLSTETNQTSLGDGQCVILWRTKWIKGQKDTMHSRRDVYGGHMTHTDLSRTKVRTWFFDGLFYCFGSPF